MATGVKELQVTVSPLEHSEVNLRVEAPAEELELAVGESLRRLSRRVRVPGFRPGKAPSAMVERMVGWENVRQDLLDEWLPEVFGAAVDQVSLEPVGDPQVTVDSLDRGSPVVFTARVAVLPKVDLGDYQSVRVEALDVEVAEASIDEVVAGLQKRGSSLVAVDRPARMGDVLAAMVRIELEDGHLLDGGEEEQEIDLGDSELTPGLADNLVSLAAGDEHSFSLAIPETAADEEFRGKQATFSVSVRQVMERTVRPVDDEFAHEHFGVDTVGEMRDEVRRRLMERAEQEELERYRDKVFDAFVELATMEVPGALVDREVTRSILSLESRLANLGLRLDRYLEYTGQTLDDLRAANREAASRNVAIDLVMDALAQAEQLEVDESQLLAEVETVMKTMRSSRPDRERVEKVTRKQFLREAAMARAVEIARGEG